MTKHIVIVHGWSDTARSFHKLSEFIQHEMQTTPQIIDLASWISMDDDVTYPDLAHAMERAWKGGNLPTDPRSVDVVVHSTGALVAREWMTTFHSPQTVPIKRFVMLAPANFGSPLAHKGQSFIGRAVKGWKSGFQTGEQILRGLELGSPYTWQLADRDLFVSPAQRWYGRDRILGTVLIGNTGYSGIESIANEHGSDGTVRIAGANLNALRLQLAFGPDNDTPTARLQRTTGAIALGVLDKENHSTLVMKDRGFRNPHSSELIIQALKVGDPDYPAHTSDIFGWQNRIDVVAPRVAAGNGNYQNTVVRLHDDLGHHVPDYFFEFYRSLRDNDGRFEQRFYTEVIGNRVHAYQPNHAYRCFNLDVAALEKLRADFTIDPLYLSVAASPEFKPPKQQVGYRSFGEGDLGRYAIPGARLGEIFSPARTALVEIGIPRWIGDKVFELRQI